MDGAIGMVAEIKIKIKFILSKIWNFISKDNNIEWPS